VEPILTLKKVGFKYETLWALKGIDLHLGAGEILGILGPNGSGKSTLLKIADGILVPQEGEVLIGNRDINSLGRSSLAGFLFQPLKWFSWDAFPI
jgi:ABC-type cobalamin/Fe3+-siderophores transport system ATPase subunit